jgi:hypothetical protein
LKSGVYYPSNPQSKIQSILLKGKRHQMRQ